MTQSSVLDPSETTLDCVLEVLASKEEIFDALKEEIQGLKEIAENHMITLGKADHQHAGYSLFFCANSPQHHMNWRLLQKDYADLYKKFREEGVVSLASPTKAQSLIFTKAKGAE